MRRLSAFLAIPLLFLAQTANTQTIPYAAVTLDIQLEGQLAYPQDLNNNGVVVANAVLPGPIGTVVLAEPVTATNKSRFKTTIFRCADVAHTFAQASSINYRGDVVGDCSTGPLGTDPIHGFLRDKTGAVTYLDFPGATQSIPLGVSSDRQVVGLYYGPPDFSRSGLYRIHGFRWANGSFETIDFQRPDTYTVLHGINKLGQVLGEYVEFDPATNATLEHGWFIYEDGDYYSLPLSFGWLGGNAIAFVDINDAGQVLGQRSNGGAGWDGLFVYQNGSSYDVELPSEYEYPIVSGMNDKGQIVGSYVRPVRFDPYYGEWIYEPHGFLATPSTSGKKR